MIREHLAGPGHVESTGFRWRGGEISRLEQFSDAVFAFALALLVVSSELPTTVDELFTVLRGFPAFGATFAVLAWLWYLHYEYFRRYGLVDDLTITLNAVLLFLILFYVYPLRFLFGALMDGIFHGNWAFAQMQGDTLLAVYSLGFVLVFAMMALLYRRALSRSAELGLNAREVAITRTSMQAQLIMVAIGLVSATLALLAPPQWVPMAGMVYFLIGPALFWHWARAAKRWPEVEEGGQPSAGLQEQP